MFCIANQIMILSDINHRQLCYSYFIDITELQIMWYMIWRLYTITSNQYTLNNIQTRQNYSWYVAQNIKCDFQSSVVGE